MFNLKSLASKFLFYECLNSVLVFESVGFYYYSCDDFWGCKIFGGHRGYCFICQLRNSYSSHEFEKIKHRPNKLINLAFQLFNDIKL